MMEGGEFGKQLLLDFNISLKMESEMTMHIGRWRLIFILYASLLINGCILNNEDDSGEKISRNDLAQKLTIVLDGSLQNGAWSPEGDKILYQKLVQGQWDIRIMDSDGSNKQKVTNDSGNKTDATFSPDGRWIVYSSDHESEHSNLFTVSIKESAPIRVTNFQGYDAAPSWSNDGRIIFESYPGDPDGSVGTTLWIIDAPIKM